MNQTTLAACLAALAVGSGCSHTSPAVARAPECQTGPEWTCMRSGPCTAPELKGQLCAVGSAEGISSLSLGREAASTRARVEMASVVRSKVDGFTRAVQDSVSKSGAGEESVQKVGSLAQNTVDETLHAVTIPKVFYNEQLKTHFALATIDARSFVDALKGLKQAGALSESVKKDIDARAESVVDEWQQDRAR